MLKGRNMQKMFRDPMHNIFFNTVQTLGRHWMSHQQWLTFQQVFLISTFVKNSVTAHWVANETDIHIIVTTCKCSLWRPQFHTTVPQCGILHYSHYILQERRRVQSQLQLFTSPFHSFHLLVFSEKCKQMKRVPCRQSQLQLWTHCASWASSKAQYEITCGKQLS